MRTKTTQQAQLEDTEFRLAMITYRMPHRLRSVAAYILWSSRQSPPAINYEEAFRLSREWMAVLDKLLSLGCLRRVERWRRIPFSTVLRRCPWTDEHEGRPGIRSDITVCGPVLGNNYKGEYRCRSCGTRRGYLDLVGLLKQDAEAQA